MFSKENLKKIDWVLVIIPIVAVIILSAILIGYPSIQKELKKLDQEFYYLTNNLIIDALIHLFSGLSEYETLLENYKQQFAKVMMEEKKKKKQKKKLKKKMKYF